MLSSSNKTRRLAKANKARSASSKNSKKKSTREKSAKKKRLDSPLAASPSSTSPSDVPSDNSPADNSNTSLASQSFSPLDNVDESETTGDVQIGEAGWPPRSTPKSTTKGRTVPKKPLTTEDVLAMLLEDDSDDDEDLYQAPELTTTRVPPSVKPAFKPQTHGGVRRSRTMSESGPLASKGKPKPSSLMEIKNSYEEEDDDESSSSSSEEEEVNGLDFDNLRQYPKSLLKAFCRREHIPVEAKKNKQKSKEDYIKALLAYNKDGRNPRTDKSEKGRNLRLSDRGSAKNGMKKSESPFIRSIDQPRNRFLVGSQPTYMPSYARGMSEEELVALAVEESLKELAKEQEKRLKESQEKEGNSGEGVDLASEKELEDDREKDRRGEGVQEGTTNTIRKSQERRADTAEDIPKPPSQREEERHEATESQYESDEAFARALQQQLQREAEMSDSGSDSEDDEIFRALTRRRGLLQMLEAMAFERGAASERAFTGFSSTLVRGPRMMPGATLGGYQYSNVDPDNMTYEELLELGERIGDVKKKGASKIVINTHTQIFKYQPPRPDEERKENSRCPICLTDFEDAEEVRMLPCIHLYHKDCVDKWLEQNAVCCVCQRPLTQQP